MPEPFWHLPGPRGMISETVHEVRRGRHVAIVLPRFMALDHDITDVLAGMLSQELQSVAYARRIYPQQSELGIAAALARELDARHPAPVTAGELVWHADLRQSIALLVVSDLDDELRDRLPRFLTRLDAETRGGSPRDSDSDKLRLVLIATRDDLPELAGSDFDITLSAVWWWNRVAHWDVASLVSRFPGPPNLDRVLADVRTETIVEISRWQLGLAEHLSRHWSGDPRQLRERLLEFTLEESTYTGPTESGPCGSRPTRDELHAWDAGWLDGWHDRRSIQLDCLLGETQRLDRATWSAQARILLPWVEQQREGLQRWLLEQVGTARFRALVEAVCHIPPTSDEVMEVGPLKRAIERQFRNRSPRHLHAARRLHSARNELAHLRPMSMAAMLELVAACEALPNGS